MSHQTILFYLTWIYIPIGTPGDLNPTEADRASPAELNNEEKKALAGILSEMDNSNDGFNRMANVPQDRFLRKFRKIFKKAKRFIRKGRFIRKVGKKIFKRVGRRFFKRIGRRFIRRLGKRIFKRRLFKRIGRLGKRIFRRRIFKRIGRFGKRLFRRRLFKRFGRRLFRRRLFSKLGQRLKRWGKRFGAKIIKYVGRIGGRPPQEMPGYMEEETPGYMEEERPHYMPQGMQSESYHLCNNVCPQTCGNY